MYTNECAFFKEWKEDYIRYDIVFYNVLFILFYFISIYIYIYFDKIMIPKFIRNV